MRWRWGAGVTGRNFRAAPAVGHINEVGAARVFEEAIVDAGQTIVVSARRADLAEEVHSMV